ncbi:MAG: 16S rRNA (cytidine(1402)-2'-O)-methyltransferase [Oscillospiraceae bacterium]|nr:16S rRNA (cytidine(1402)-2'-O)-methyltransferase [Oscillospiraceae bacterium]
MEVKKGCLYLVGTPIGNLSDITERAVFTLENADFIAAEDTRVTGLLLSKICGVKKPLTSFHEFNASQKGKEITEKLTQGESCALVTDAGMPCISDPGESLVRLCYESGIPVYVVPGASAVTAALAVSGLDTGRFVFEGFLPSGKKQRSVLLDSLKDERRTLVFYESPHRLRATLSDLHAILGDRQIAVCRELTKLYEQVLRGALSEIIAVCGEKEPRGEYVLVVSGASPPPKRQKVNKYENFSKIKESNHDE